MGLIDGLKAIRGKLETATRAVHDEIGSVRVRIRELRKAITDAQAAPVPLDELEVRVRQVVDKTADSWLQKHGRELFLTPVPGSRALAAYATAGRLRLPDGVEDMFGLLCVSEPERAVRLLMGIAKARPYEAGCPSAERLALLDRLKRELADLESFEEGAIDEAAAAGVVIGHRPEVLHRRQNEARARELEEQAVADRRRRQEAIDAEAQPRVGVSEYLGTERAGRPLKLS